MAKNIQVGDKIVFRHTDRTYRYGTVVKILSNFAKINIEPLFAWEPDNIIGFARISDITLRSNMCCRV